MQSGKTNVYTKFERKMLSDIRDIRKLKDEVDLKDMKRTQDQMKFGKVL